MMKVEMVTIATLLFVAVIPRLGAQSTEEPSLDDLILSASEVNLLKWGEGNLDTGLPLSHYDEKGYPEDAEGQLVLKEHNLGPMVFVENESQGRLLYAQFENRQRDAVILARTGTLRDPLPNGTAFEVPYGSGALKQNESVVSLVEARVVPHLSDNRKTYQVFPLRDIYLGASVGSTGVTASARYVSRERYVGYVRAGINTFGRINPRSVLNTYWIPLHLGAGYRFPGFLSEFLAENLMTAAGDVFLGFGDRDSDPSTPSAVLLPGALLEIERLLYDTAHSKQDFRTDPRPYNYRVNSFSLRIGAYLDVPTARRGGSWFRLILSTGVQFNVIGPEIPEHAFKTTDVRYVHEYYVEDLKTQAARREARRLSSVGG